MLTRYKAIILGVGALVFAGQAQAITTGECQVALEKVGGKVESAVMKALAKCVKAGQGEIDEGGAVTIDTSDACEGAIVKADKAAKKTLGKCLGLAEEKCSEADLYMAGHLVSKANGDAAIGDVTDFSVDDPAIVASHVDFACQWMVNHAYQNAIKQLFARVPNAQARIVEAAAADLADTTGPCFDDVTDAEIPCANLQAFSNNQPRCATHTCRVSASSSSAFLRSSTLGDAPLTLTGYVGIDVCRPVAGTDTATVQTGTMLLDGSVGKGLPPVNLGIATVCVRTIKVEGECNCGQTSAALGDITLCRDADTTTGTDCAVGTAILSPAGGTDNGPLYVSFGGSALGSAGCHGALTVEFALHNGPPASNSCTTAGPTTTKLAPSSVLFTTGSVSGTVLDTAAGDITAVGGYPLTGGSSPGAVATGGCTALEASTLTGMKVVGAQPALDGGTTGDAIIGVALNCQ